MATHGVSGTAAAANLSLLSRGVGAVKKNGHERIDVHLEPEDYFNYIDSPRRFILPPIIEAHHPPTKYAFEDTPRQKTKEGQSVPLPKTFTTRKGALLLFSEDFALKSGQDEGDEVQGHRYKADDLAGELKTVDDLTRSILAYGSHRSEVHLKFVRDVRTTKKVRPGFSARRYLSRLTRSFDDNFLDNLMSKGYVNEKTLFTENSLRPNMRRRINDDLSYMPAPYRIMKQMLMAPGILSGYSFYKAKTMDSEISGITVIAEEDESPGESPTRDSRKIHVVEMRAGIPHTVSYGSLSQEDKENVLADLLVKSAINHALDQQKVKLTDVTEEDDEEERSVHEVTRVNEPHHDSRRTSINEFNMAEAVQSYLESQIDASSVREGSVSSQTGLRGAKVPSHSARSFEARERKWPETEGEKEFIGGVPVVAVRSTQGSVSSHSPASSRRSSLGAISSSAGPSTHIGYSAPPKPLTPIIDVSREASLNPIPILPPIKNISQESPGHVDMPSVNIYPHPAETDQAEEPDSRSHTARDATDEATKRDSKKLSQRSVHSLDSALSQLDAGHHSGAEGLIYSSTESLNVGFQNSSTKEIYSGRMRGKALKAGGDRPKKGPSSVKSSGSVKGSIIFGPRGEMLSVGGSIASKQESLPDLHGDTVSEPGVIGVSEDEVELWAGRRSGSRSADAALRSLHRSSPIAAGRKLLQARIQPVINVELSQAQLEELQDSLYIGENKDSSLDLKGGNFNKLKVINDVKKPGMPKKDEQLSANEVPSVEAEHSDKADPPEEVMRKTRTATTLKRRELSVVTDASIERSPGSQSEINNDHLSARSEKKEETLEPTCNEDDKRVEDDRDELSTRMDSLAELEPKAPPENNLAPEVAEKTHCADKNEDGNIVGSNIGEGKGDVGSNKDEATAKEADLMTADIVDKARQSPLTNDKVISAVSTPRSAIKTSSAKSLQRRSTSQISNNESKLHDDHGKEEVDIPEAKGEQDVGETLQEVEQTVPSGRSSNLTSDSMPAITLREATEEKTVEKSPLGSAFSGPITEQELVKALSEHAHNIAMATLSRPGTGMDIATDAQIAAELWLASRPQSVNTMSTSLQKSPRDNDSVVIEQLMNGGANTINPSVEEYREMLRETLSSVVSKMSGGSPENFPQDAEVSPELIEALTQQKLSPDDIEVVQDETGKSVIRIKSEASSRISSSVARDNRLDSATSKIEVPRETTFKKDEKTRVGKLRSGSILSGKTSDQIVTGDVGKLDIINYGEAENQEEKQDAAARVQESDKGKARHSGKTGSQRGSAQSSVPGKKSISGRESEASNKMKDEDDDAKLRQLLENMVQPEHTKASRKSTSESRSLSKSVSQKTSAKSKKSSKSDKSKKTEKSAKKESDDRSSLDDRDEFVVGKVEDKRELENLYKPLEEPAKAKEKKPRVPVAKSPKKGKKKAKKDKTPEVEQPDTPPQPEPKEPTPPPQEEEPLPPTPPKEESPAPSSEWLSDKEEEEEEMEFIIVRDEFEDTPTPPPPQPVKSVEKTPEPSIPDSEDSYMEEASDGESDVSGQLKLISNKEARAAKRAAQAAKRREEVERKRKEREEIIRQEREEAERKERLQRELEEERAMRDREKRLQREAMEEERRRREREEEEREKRARAEAERERRQREEYQRKLEEMKRKQREEERLRQEMEEKRRQEEELRRIEEELLMSKMAEEERLEYERKKREEEERRRIEEEEARIRREEEARIAMEEAKRLAEELARKKAEYEKRLQFNRSLQLESTGLEHTQEVTRAFVFSYYEFLQWLGLEVPDFERLKKSMGM